MKKNNKKKLIKGGNKKQAAINFRKAVSIILPIAAAALILASLYALYTKTPYFVVRDVIIAGREHSSSVNYAELEKMILDKNIFKLDLKEIRDYMISNYRELLELQLERAFPHSIIANVTLRKAAAELHEGRYYPVDGEGIILSRVTDSPVGGLPVISGIRKNISKHIGKAIDSKRIKKALLLLEEIRKSGILERHKLVEVDVSSIRNIIFFLEDGMEVKIGGSNFTSRLENLKQVLLDPKLKPEDIRYIDLRFKDPVIGPKWKR